MRLFRAPLAPAALLTRQPPAPPASQDASAGLPERSWPDAGEKPQRLGLVSTGLCLGFKACWGAGRWAIAIESSRWMDQMRWPAFCKLSAIRMSRKPGDWPAILMTGVDGIPEGGVLPRSLSGYGVVDRSTFAKVGGGLGFAQQAPSGGIGPSPNAEPPWPALPLAGSVAGSRLLDWSKPSRCGIFRTGRRGVVGRQRLPLVLRACGGSTMVLTLLAGAALAAA